MYLSGISAAVLALSGITQAAVLQPRDLLQDLQNQALQNLKEAELSGILAKRSCSLSNAGIRQDW
jgi:tyrosinase